MIAWIFAIVVIAIVGKLMYDVQQKKNKPTQTEDGFDKDTFQKLNEQIVDALLKAAENSEFPKPDESMNVQTTKIGTIHTNFGDNDPLATIPMSRVSVEGKKKMAKIAKEDINKQLEQNTKRIAILAGLNVDEPKKPKRKYNKKPKQ
jgi:hypothetical protein